jgi:hypothetical protein
MALLAVPAFAQVPAPVADVPVRMSAFRCIPDLAPKGAEGRFMTQIGHSGPVVATARSGLLAPLGDSLDMAKADVVAGLPQLEAVRYCYLAATAPRGRPA